MTDATRLLVFSDPGIDDALALSLMSCAEGLRCLRLVGVNGNVPAQQAARNLTSLAKLLSLDCPVFLDEAAEGASPGREA